MLAQVSEYFASADVSGDGLLDIVEYVHFHKMQNKARKLKGFFVDTRENQIRNTYQIINKYSKQTLGISEADYLTWMGIWNSKVEAYKLTSDDQTTEEQSVRMGLSMFQTR